jgi:hypothetical protein
MRGREKYSGDKAIYVSLPATGGKALKLFKHLNAEGF